MAEPAHAPTLPDAPWPPGFEPPVPHPVTGLPTSFVESLPRLPSLDALRALTERDLPESDGEPMPESLIQWPVLGYTYYAFSHHFRHRPDVFVGCDGFVYAEGPPEPDGTVRPLAVAPDVMVAFGVEQRRRSSYLTWVEGGPPAFVLEVASPSTWRRDRDAKPGLYASMGVREYFLYDPVGGRLAPRVQGRVLDGGAYRARPVRRMDTGTEGVWSEVLGLWAFLKGEEEALRWYDPVAGKELEDPAEVHEAREVEAAARRAAEARAAEEAAARRAAEARAAEEAAACKAAEEKLAELQARVLDMRRGSHA